MAVDIGSLTQVPDNELNRIVLENKVPGNQDNEDNIINLFVQIIKDQKFPSTVQTCREVIVRHLIKGSQDDSVFGTLPEDIKALVDEEFAGEVLRSYDMLNIYNFEKIKGLYKRYNNKNFIRFEKACCVFFAGHLARIFKDKSRDKWSGMDLLPERVRCVKELSLDPTKIINEHSKFVTGIVGKHFLDTFIKKISRPEVTVKSGRFH